MLMKQKLALMIVVLLAAFYPGCVAKNVVSKVAAPLNGKRQQMQGVFYALPRTVVVASIPIKKEVSKPGEFQKFARCFFPNEEVIERQEAAYSVGTPTFATRGEPDPTKVFMVKISGHYLEDKTLQLDLTPGGVYIKGEAETKNNALEFTTKAIKTAISIGAEAAKVGLAAASAAKLSTLRDSLSPRARACFDHYLNVRDQSAANLPARVRNLLSNKNAAAQRRDGAEKNKNTPALETATVDLEAADRILNETLNAADRELALDPSKRSNRFTDAELRSIDAFKKAQDDVDDFQRASRLFDRIVGLQTQRLQLLSTANQTSGLSPETLKLMLKELDDAIETSQSKFLGSTITVDPWIATFEVMPGENEAHFIQRLFELSKKNGVCSLAPEFSFINVPEKFRKKPGVPCTDVIEATLKIDKGRFGNLEPQLSDTVTAATFSQDGERGFYYRVPAVALAKLEIRERRNTGERTEYTQIQERGRSNVMIAQLGTIVSLPATTNGRTTKYTLALYEDSGALQTFNLGSSALIQNSLLEDVQGAATSINGLRSAMADAKAKEKAAAAAQSDELAQLQRKSAILELQLKIKELEDKLRTSAP